MSRLFPSLVFFLAISQTLFATTFHIAAWGNDSNDGSSASPFATLQRARDVLRHTKRVEPARVVIHAGSYFQSAPFDLTSDDSGTEQSPIVWQAATNEEVRLTGGRMVPANAFTLVTDQVIASRITEKARGHILQLDLRPYTDSDLGYPTQFAGAPATPELFINDQRMSVAQWPNQGWAYIPKIIDSGAIPRDGDTSGRVPTFEFTGEEPLRWNIDAGVWLQGYWCFDWFDATIRVRSIDRKQHRITLDAPALYGVKQLNPNPRRFRALNVLEELDEPGEFYIDPVARRLYVWPTAPIAGSRVVLSTLKGPVLRLKEVSHLTLRGLIIEASLADGIDVTGGQHVLIDGCTVRNTRELGIAIRGGQKHRLENSDIYDTGTGGLLLEGGDRKTLTPAGHEAINNHIWNFSRLQLTGAYAITLSGVGNRAAHNLIHDAPHQAVLIIGNDHIFELNIVRNVATETDDAGAIYKGRNPSCRGNIIRNNFFADIGNPTGPATGIGTCAVYFDDGDGGDFVLGNVFLRCGNPGSAKLGAVFSHGGHDIHAENNIFIDCKRALGSSPFDDATWKQAIAGGLDCGWTTKLLQEVDITKPPYTTHYPELIGFMDPKPGAERNNYARNNVLVRCADALRGNWRAQPDGLWHTDSDSIFISPTAGDYGLKADAEVYKQLPAFKPIPFDQIGLISPSGRRPPIK